MKPVVRIVCLTVVLMLTLIGGPGQALAQSEIVCESDVVVQADDWLSKIADKFYGDLLTYPVIAEATNAKAAIDDSYATIENVDLIEPGWKLCIPNAAEAETILAGAVAAKRGGTLVVAGESIGDNYMPAAATQGWAHTWILSNIYEGLYTSRDLKTLQPALATGYTISDDGLVYTFRLRQGVKFHDGTPFNADAVVFNYMRYLDENHPYYEPNAPWRTAFLSGVTTIQAKDEYTVEFTLEQPKASFPASLSTYFSGIVSPAAIEQYGVEEVVRHPVGTGPFVFERGEKGNQASMVAFDDYWGGRPYLDRVVVRAIADDQTMAASLMAGEVDVTPFVDFKDLETFRNNPDLDVVVVPATATGYIAINQAHETMQDVRVRQAIAHAVDKQKIIDVIFFGEADIASGLTSIPMWAYAPQFTDYYPFDPQKARELLEETGGAPPITLFTQSSGFWPRMAELIQADLAEVGFETTIEKIDPAAFYGQMTEGTHQLFLGDAAQQTPDPEDLYFILYGCENARSKRWGYCNEAFDELMLKQSGLTDQEERKEVLWQMQKMLLDDVVQVFTYYNRFAYVLNKRVEGFNPMPVRFMYLHDTYVNEK